MSNAAVIRERVERWTRDRRLVPEHFAPGFVWDMGPADWPGEDEYHGTEGMNRFLRDWMEAFTEWDFEIDDALDTPDGKVLVLGTQRGVNRGAGVPVEMRMAQIWTLDDEGRAVRMEMYTDRAQGMAAAGIT